MGMQFQLYHPQDLHPKYKVLTLGCQYIVQFYMPNAKYLICLDNYAKAPLDWRYCNK
jgi:hypothetical protein